MKTVEVLKAARELIATPEKWGRGGYAADAAGEPTELYSPDATCWCSLGAIFVALGAAPVLSPADDVVPGFREARDALRSALGGGFVVSFNDHPTTTHADVLALFDRAIAAEENKT